jgi:hypothetical protein
MGAINYKKNKYVTLALKTDFLYEEDCDEEEGNDTIYFIYEETNFIIKQYNFEYFDISIENGYYEGFYIDFDFKRDYIESWKDRALLQKEITQLRRLFIELVDYELNVCFPGWVTTWLDYKQSKEAVNEAIKKIREAAKKLEIWR